MSNYLNNRVSASLNGKQVSELKGHLDAFEAKMPFLLGLTKDERIKMLKMRRDNKLFVEDAIRVAKEFPDLLPKFLSAEEFARDYVLYGDLDEFEELLIKLLQMVRDTRMVAGSEALQAALILYRLSKIGVAAGLPGAESGLKRMKKRFEDQGRHVEDIENDKGEDLEDEKEDDAEKSDSEDDKE